METKPSAVPLHGSSARSSLLASSESFADVDLWIHDSDHSSHWQKLEFNLAVSEFSPNGILVSDDIDSSTAWLEIANDHKLESFCAFRRQPCDWPAAGVDWE